MDYNSVEEFRDKFVTPVAKAAAALLEYEEELRQMSLAGQLPVGLRAQTKAGQKAITELGKFCRQIRRRIDEIKDGTAGDLKRLEERVRKYRSKKDGGENTVTDDVSS